jgi:Cdc6-like AAA superfamily ATPase
MASELSSLITQLKAYQLLDQGQRPNALNFIVDYTRFMTTLEKIEAMIGLDLAKQQIAQQVKSFIVNYRRFGKPTNREMLHTLIYGPPGCGKTELGQLLAELWATSGCLPNDSKTDQPLFLVHRNSKNAPSAHNTQTDMEKIALRQNLAIKETMIRQHQDRLRTITATVGSVLTNLNNVRKKIKPKNDGQELRVQAKFQKIKENLKEMLGEQAQAASPLRPGATLQVLPVTVPKIPGVRSRFGAATIPPLLPSVPTTGASTPALKAESAGFDPISFLLQQTPKVEPAKPLSKFTRITRGDLIGKYQGHTTDQVREILLQHVGGVVMIDEAYNLLTSSQDDFGKELLTEIINFMTTWPDKIIFIFAGYRKEMEESVLKFQPGLARRFNWTFEITEYSPSELCKIFQKQLRKVFTPDPKLGKVEAQVEISEETLTKIEKLFQDNKDKFPFFGGDTERLCTCLKEVINSQNWERALDDTMTNDDFNKLFTEISFESFESAYKKYLENSAKLKEEQRKKDEEEKAKKESMSKIGHLYS